MPNYEQAPEVRRVAQRMIDQHHPHLRAIRMEYVFRPKATRRRGRRVAATARKVSGVHALLATEGAVESDGLDFFLVIVARDLWDLYTPTERDALVDHELNHFGVEIDDESGVAHLVLLGHDIEAFDVEIRRHGMWRTDLEDFVRAIPVEQLELAVSPGQAAADADGVALEPG